MPKKKNARKKAAAVEAARWAERRRLVRQEALRKVRKGLSRSAGEEGHAGKTPQADAADLLEPLVGAIVERKDPRIALSVDVGLQRISDLEGPEAAGYFGAALLGVVFGWLVGAREAGLAPREAGQAVEWIRDAFGADAERAVLMLAGLIGHPDARDGTVDDAMDELGDAFLPAAIWLVAGVVATAGGGDTAWLRQFDLAPAG